MSACPECRLHHAVCGQAGCCVRASRAKPPVRNRRLRLHIPRHSDDHIPLSAQIHRLAGGSSYTVRHDCPRNRSQSRQDTDAGSRPCDDRLVSTADSDLAMLSCNRSNCAVVPVHWAPSSWMFLMVLFVPNKSESRESFCTGSRCLEVLSALWSVGCV